MRPRSTRRQFIASAAATSSLFGREDAQMKVGCQTRAFGSPLADPKDLFAALNSLKKAGYDGFETNYRSLEWAFDEPGPARRRLQSTGIEMIGLHAGFGLFDHSKVEDELQLAKWIAKAVAELGGKHLILSGRRLPLGPNGRAEAAALSRRARNLNHLGAHCRRLGVRLSIHNHTYEVRHDGDEIRRTLAQTDPEHLSLLLDIGHVHHAEVDIPGFAHEHSERLAGLHVRDVAGGEEVFIGKGTVNFSKVAHSLREADWSGWVIAEVNRREDTAPGTYVGTVREHLRTTMRI